MQYKISFINWQFQSFWLDRNSKYYPSITKYYFSTLSTAPKDPKSFPFQQSIQRHFLSSCLQSLFPATADTAALCRAFAKLSTGPVTR